MKTMDMETVETWANFAREESKDWFASRLEHFSQALMEHGSADPAKCFEAAMAMGGTRAIATMLAGLAKGLRETKVVK